jgi:hypothetical protein
MRGADERGDERERQEASVIVGAELPKLPATSFASHPNRAFARLLSAPLSASSMPLLSTELVHVPLPRVSAHNKGEHERIRREW